MIRIGKIAAIGLATAILALAAATADAKDKVKVGFIGPLTGGVSVNGLGGRNSADLAVQAAQCRRQGEIRIRAGRARR